MSRARTVHDRVLISHRKVPAETGESLDFSNRMHGLLWYLGALLLGLLLSWMTGCSSVPKPPGTEVFCSVTSDRAAAMNNVGPVQIGLEIAPHQVERLCAVPAVKQ